MMTSHVIGAVAAGIATIQMSAQAGDAAKQLTRLPVPALVADAAERGDVTAVRRLVARGMDASASQGDGMTALHWASHRCDLTLARLLIAAHAKIDAVTRLGAYTPLHVAGRVGCGRVARLLLSRGANPNATNGAGSTPLHLAAASGNEEAVRALLSYGADPNARENEWEQTPLVFAAEYDRPAAISALLAGGANPSIHTRAISIPREAARQQEVSRKRNDILLSYMPKERRDSVENAFASARKTAIAARAQGLDPEPATPGDDSAVFLVRTRVPNGRPQAKGPFTPEQIQSAIAEARKVLVTAPTTEPFVERVDTLNGGIPGFAAAVGGMGGLSPLHHAVRQGNLSAVIALLEGGAKIDDATDVDHTSSLLLAAINGQFDIALELLRRGANPNAQSAIGLTPLYAVLNTQWAPKSRYPQPQALQLQRSSYIDVMTALLQAGADPNIRLARQPWYFAFNNCGSVNCGLENLEGTNAFWRAAYAVDIDAMRLLATHGANVDVPAQRMVRAISPTVRAVTVSTAAIAARKSDTADRQSHDSRPLPARDSIAIGLGTYPIHAAAGSGYGNGLAANAHRHAPDGWIPAMRFLVEEMHADVNQRDAKGYTALHHAAARGDNEMIVYLVAHGADVRAVSSDGMTTVDMANGPIQRLSPIPATIALLERLGAVKHHRCVSC